MNDRDFKPRQMAQGMLALAPDRAEQVTLALRDDAIQHGDHDRARMWSEVLAHVRLISANDRVLVH